MDIMVTAGTKVMILDDDEEFLEELKETLSLSGFDVVAVSDVDVFLKEVYEIKPSVILLDLRMPKKSGFEVASELQKHVPKSCIPIIAMSAFSNDNSVLLLKSLGIRKILKKPFNPLNIIAEIEDVLA
jgi:DNA-binding response OmpR family regulator